MKKWNEEEKKLKRNILYEQVKLRGVLQFVSLINCLIGIYQNVQPHISIKRTAHFIFFFRMNIERNKNRDISSSD